MAQPQIGLELSRIFVGDLQRIQSLEMLFSDWILISEAKH